MRISVSVLVFAFISTGAISQDFKQIHKYNADVEGSNIAASLDTKYNYISIVGDNEIDDSIKTIAIFKKGSGKLLEFANALMVAIDEKTTDLTITGANISVQGIKVLDELSIVIVSTEGEGVYTTINRSKALAFAKSVANFLDLNK